MQVVSTAQQNTQHVTTTTTIRTNTGPNTSINTDTDTNIRTQQAWQQARALLGSTLIGAGALVASAVGATTAVAVEPTLEFGGSLSGNHNSSGFFTADAHSGSAAGQAFGRLDEGVKLYGDASLPRDIYKFNTWTTHPDDGFRYTTSDSTGLAMAWWGTALNLRSGLSDENTGELIQMGDSFAFHYEFTVQGPQGTQWEIKGGFVQDLYLNSSSGLLQANYLGRAGATGYLEADGSQTFSGNLQTDNLYGVDTSQALYWLVTLTADLPYDPSMDLRLTVPQNSIDAGVNLVPTPVPEPSQWALLMAGIAAVAGVVKRRQRPG